MLLIIGRNKFVTSFSFARRLCAEAFGYVNNQKPAEQTEGDRAVVKHSSTEYSTAEYSTAEYSTADYSTAECSPVEHQETQKCLKVAILGNPNVGKSTLVNQLVTRNMCAASSKVHTTQCKASAVYTENDTQLVFIDTPGIVTAKEIKMYKLKSSFEKDPVKSLQLADVIGIVQDATNYHTNSKINECLLETINRLQCEKPIFLVLNKIDLLKKKGILLTIVEQLLRNKMHPKFAEIFMVSALNGSGVNRIRRYLLSSAKPAKWLFNPNAYTDQDIETVVEQTVRAKLMDSLLNEMPYRLHILSEHVTMNNDGGVMAAVRVTCPSEHYLKVILGPKGKRVREIAHATEEDLRNALRAAVSVKIILAAKNK